jgi:hypothetical protein
VTTPEDRRIRHAIDMQEAEERVSAMGTPRGLRNLFPTNLVRSRIRNLSPAAMQRIIMSSKNDAKRTEAQPTQDAPRNVPARPGQPSPSHTSTDGTSDAPDPATRPVLPSTKATPGPREAEGEQQGEDGEQGTPAAKAAYDPGPAPAMPVYGGPTSTAMPAAVDQLLMAASARDRDAVRAVPTRNELPAVGQYKANLLQWLDDMDAHDADRNMTAAGEGIDADSSGNGVEEDILGEDTPRGGTTGPRHP